MQKRYLSIIVILGAIAGLNLGMIASHVKADSGQCPCGDAPGAGYACNNCNDYVHQPKVSNLSDETTCHFWKNGYARCEPGPFFGYHSSSQLHLTQVAFFRDNCFWSYPVQCSGNQGGVNLHLRTL